MSSYSGKIKYGDAEFHYTYSEEKHELEIASENEKGINVWYEEKCTDWLKLESYDYPTLVIRIGREKYSGRRGTKLYDVDDCLVIWNFRGTAKDEIHRITYRSDALDYFYRPKNHLSNISKEINQFCKKEKAYCRKIRTYKFSLGEKQLSFFINETVERKPYEARNIIVYNTLYVESKDALTYDEVVKLNTFVKRFLSFVSNARDVAIRHIGINEYGYSTNINYTYGHFVLKNNTGHKITCEVLRYEDISLKMENLLKAIEADNICFISLFQYEESSISTVDIMNICAAFENQFNITYKNYRDHELSKAREEIVKKIKGIIKDRKENGKNTEVYEELLQSVSLYKNSLFHKLEYAFNDFKAYISRYTNCPDLYLGKNYDDIPKLIKDARNKLDHGSKKNEVYIKELMATPLVRIVVYYMILKSIGLSGKRLARCISGLFSIPLIIK